MDENTYILNVLNGLGLAINDKEKSEILINFPIKLDKKNHKFTMDTNYKISIQILGIFLSEFLNLDFEEYNDFFDFFLKYPSTFLSYEILSKYFKNNCCSEKIFKKIIHDFYKENKKLYINLQEQTDMILDYCLFNPNRKASKFKEIERLYVLRRISPTLTLLNENKSGYYSVNLFSNFPGNSENDIYEFLSKPKNKVIELDLIIPYNISSILYKSLCSILKGRIYLKVCKNCNRYFIATKNSNLYCSNTAPNESKKTCKQIGRKKSFENMKNKDEMLNLYYQVYNRKSTMKSRNPDIKIYVDDFNKYKNIGKKKLDKYKSGKLSSDEFKDWIKKQI